MIGKEIQLNDQCARCGDNRLQHASKYPYDHSFQEIEETPFRHVMDWDRFGRKGQRCEILKGQFSQVQIRFEDGHTEIVNRMALRRAKPSELKKVDETGNP